MLNRQLQLVLPVRFCFVAAILVTILGSTGCVRRRMTVRTNPPGAVLYVDNQEVGVTPVSTDYLYYGDRILRLEKDGFEPVEQSHKFKVPWYQYPPLDFVTENLIPWEIRDEREIDFEMKPQRIVPPAELRQRAEQMRANATAGFAVPVPPTQPPQQTRYSLGNAQNPTLAPPYSPNPPQVQFPANQNFAPPVNQPGTLPPGGYQLPPPIQ
ncbi:MAG: hypothetical protein COA78_23240 [Blastopirellula sp.]|nr:MAG: hypothetical protein COA78_23240 [Blastopirellula sp.]